MVEAEIRERNRRITGERIRERMRQLGINQVSMAARIGVTQVSMSRYVRGQRTPSAHILSKLAQELQCTQEYLTNTEKNEDPDMVFFRILRDVDRYSGRWSAEQKTSLFYQLIKNAI